MRMRFACPGASREAWPDALKALTEAAGVAGAALIILNKHTGNVEEARFFGLSAEFKSDYIRHYATLDPYLPLLDGSGKNSPNASRIRYCAEANGTTIWYWHAAFATFLGRGLSIRLTITSPSVFISRSAGAFPRGSIPSSSW
jgi:hypothetical protein